MNKIIISSFIITNLIFTSFAQQHKVSGSIDWANNDLIVALNEINEIPKQEGIYNPNENFSTAVGEFYSISYSPVSLLEGEKISKLKPSFNIEIDVRVVYEKKNPVINYSFLPYRINPETKQIEKVENYEIYFTLINDKLKSTQARSYATNSLLENGNWYKIKVDTSGIFRLSYNELIQIGLSTPENARMYSYGGKQLSYSNSDFNYDDLVEIPIALFKGGDGIFNEGDYIIFYAEGPTTWYFDESKNMFIHQKHNFSKYTYLFISDALGAGGLKIEETDNENLISNYTSNSFDGYACYEYNKLNLIKSGRTWYGNKFSPGSSASINFTFPNIISSEPAYLYTLVAGRKQIAGESCFFNISNNSSNLGSINITDAYSTYVYGHEYQKTFEIINATTSINLKYTFNGANSAMEGYLDFVCLNVRENLKMQGSQFMFRDIRTVNAGITTQFNIDNTGKSISVWDITNATKPYKLKLSNQNSVSSFKISTDTLNQFIAFDETGYFSPIIIGDDLGLVQNQNLHGIQSNDMIIITHPLFQKQAEELAEIHRIRDNMSVYVTQPQTIYNEFSSGTPDISAIRNFMRMLYDKAAVGEEPKYLLLFGDGSYDNWTTGAANTNFIPTYQNTISLSETSSYVSDDYYGMLDLNEGEIVSGGETKLYGLVDIGIGRLPVQTVEEAELMISKINHYLSPKSFGSWKTNICFIGDDEDGGLHMRQPEKIDREIIKKINPEYNVNKIYLDAYKQISTPSGQRYPDVTSAINDQVEQGALIIDYVGHGNPRILAHEEILSTNNVRSWKNEDKLSIFVTASCEVGRFDDYDRVSLGEWFLLNPDGGGIATLTTTRVVYSGGNDDLNRSFFQNAFNPNLRFGDVVRIAKNNQGASGTNHRNFSLLGDPAIGISVPKNIIVIGNINNNFLEIEDPIYNENNEAIVAYATGDTINALSKALVEGYIDDSNGNPFNENGVMYVTIYDKTDTLYTYGQDNPPLEFILQNNIIYKGKATISKGFFSFNFIVPKDINYKFGKGKISLYAVLDTSEALGFSENIIIGGNSSEAEDDINGPEMALFMNDTTFRNGGITNENPIFIAKLSDENGINTTGIGFGHNITALLDGNQEHVYMLNNYFEGDLDKYNSGRVRYPFTNLAPGYHYITFKSWDIYNNSSESVLEFYVQESSSVIIDNMYNAPNPFSDETWFSFDHNQSYDDSDYDAFKINIQIFDIMGKKVTELNQKNSSAGYTISPIWWNGTNSAGAKLPKGVYIYRTEITATNGQKTYKSSKLMIF